MALQLDASARSSPMPARKPELAERAAEEIAGYDRQLADMRGDLLVLKWMVGAVLALTAIGTPALWLLLRVAGKVGAL
jgi:hypothetical protein